MFDVLKKDGLSDEATLEKRLQLSLEPRFPQRFQLVGKEHSRKMKNSWSQDLKVETWRPRKRITMRAEDDKGREYQEGSWEK